MSKYVFDTKQIKKRLKCLRYYPDGRRKYTQNEVAKAIKIKNDDNKDTSRTTVTAWENYGNETIPDTRTLVDLCNFYDCDLDYIFSKTDVISSDIKSTVDTLHISEKSIKTLRNNKEYGQLLDKIINNKIFGEISNRVHQLALNKVLDDVITTCFNKNFEYKIENIFNEYYFSVFPYNMSQEKYSEYIKNSIPYSTEFNPEKFIEDNFLDDGKNFIRNKSDNFSSLSKSEQYEIIISSIADISYDYYISQNLAELSKQKLDLMLSELLQDAINMDTAEIKSSLKKRSAPSKR